MGAGQLRMAPGPGWYDVPLRVSQVSLDVSICLLSLSHSVCPTHQGMK